MGFDIYGVAPVEHTPKPVSEKDFTDMNDQEKNEYYKALNQFEEENPGAYFRNSVWWWRPLWYYVCKVCEAVMTKKQMLMGTHNSGNTIDEETVEKMIIILEQQIADGLHKEYEKTYYEDLNKLPDEPCTTCNSKGFRYIEAKDQIEECHTCKGRGMREAWDKSYPFSYENVENFVKFLSESGGIQIC